MIYSIKSSLKKTKLRTTAINLFYGKTQALRDVTMDIPERAVTAVIGPSGCGKSSLLRLFNRMNDLIPSARVEGCAFIGETPIYGKGANAAELRKRIGMVFQKPNVFPMSISENITTALKRRGIKNKADLSETAERVLKQAALWEGVKYSLNKPARTLSAGEQQRLCIARTLAVNPEVILMDEPCSALDPESTAKIEELIAELARKYTIVIVTHNMEQARRVSDMSAFMMLDDISVGGKAGRLVEYSPTSEMFSSPKNKRTEDYIIGRFG